MVKFWHWTKKRTRAAQLVAEDQLTDDEIASELGISRRSLACWKKHSDFASRVGEIVEAMRQAILAEGIANRQNRVDALNARWQRMKRVIDERERQHANIDSLKASPAAGASTGLMVLTIRYLPGGSRVEEWAVDTGLLKAMNETEKQAAIELGQWEEKSQVSGGVLIREYGVPVDDV